MAHKVNPISNRLQLNREFNHSWFSNYYYSELLTRDLLLNKYLTSLRLHMDIHRTEPKNPFRISLYTMGANFLYPNRGETFRKYLFRLPRKMKRLVQYEFRRHIIKRGCIFQNKLRKRTKKPFRYKNQPSSIFYIRYYPKKTLVDLINATPVLGESSKKRRTPKGFFKNSTLLSTVYYDLPYLFTTNSRR